MPGPGCPKCKNLMYQTFDADEIRKRSHIEKHLFMIAGELVDAHFRYDRTPMTQEETRHPWGRGRLPCRCNKCGFEWDWETDHWWTW